MENIKLNPTQRVALLWLKNVDNSLILYNAIKSLNSKTRALFYIGVIAFTAFGLLFLKSFIPASYMFEPWLTIGNIIFYGTIVGMIAIVTLESVIKLDVKQIIEAKKAEKQKIKNEKKQWWRLRNMRFISRLGIYITVYIMITLYLNIIAQGAFYHVFATAPNTPLVQQQVVVFMNDFNFLMKVFTFIYMIMVFILDYFVQKNRNLAATKEKEVQNEKNI